jgi:hypothetical protein
MIRSKKNIRVRSGIFVLILLLSIFLSQQVITVLSEQENYGTSEVVLSGLSNPFIETMDEQGRIYFIEYHQEGSKMICTLSRFDPQNNKLVKIASREGFIRHVGLDAGNNIYYVLGDLYAPNEIHRISRDLKTDILLYRTEDNFFIIDMAVDKLGNVYFALSRYGEEGAAPPLPPSRLMRLSANGSVQLLVEFNDAYIYNIQVPMNPTQGVFFSAPDGDKVCVFQYVNGTLRVLETKPRGVSISEEWHDFLYMTLGRDGDLYWIYRERSGFNDPDQWGYLEISRLTQSDIKRGTEGKVLWSKYFEDRGVYGWFPGRKFFGVSLTGDLFFTVLFRFDNGTWKENLLWLDAKTGTVKALLTTERSEYYSFVIDPQGNLYVSLGSSGSIIRINRG